MYCGPWVNLQVFIWPSEQFEFETPALYAAPVLLLLVEWSPRVLDFCMNSFFLAPFTSRHSLVLSYIRTTKCSNCIIQASLISPPRMFVISKNASLTSGNTFHVSQAVFFPLPPKDDSIAVCKSMECQQARTYLWS